LEKNVPSFTGHRDRPAPAIREFLRALDAIPASVVVADLEGKIVQVNGRITEALGYPREELIGEHVQVLSGGALHPEAFRAIWEATLAGGWRGEILNYRKDGTTFPLFLETAVLRDDAGEPVLLLGVGRNISDQRAFQERLLIEAKLGTLGLLCHNVSHEVRNHLSAIKLGLYQLADRDTPHEQAKEHLSIVREEIDRIELFLRTLENYTHPPRAHFEEMSLLDAINQGLDDARPLLIQKTINLHRQFPAHPPRVVLDRLQFAQAVTQVVQNASEAVAAGGEIHVVVKRQPLRDRIWWLVEIRDNGPGVPANLRPRVFEPFFTTSANRLGLGLTNVWRILELHGGSADLTSLPTGGTTVVLRIPGDDGED
jgi:PAS domain S-box-containing protein